MADFRSRFSLSLSQPVLWLVPVANHSSQACLLRSSHAADELSSNVFGSPSSLVAVVAELLAVVDLVAIVADLLLIRRRSSSPVLPLLSSPICWKDGCGFPRSGVGSGIP
ncbi:hypothetical protein L484_023578 [Morus notabilis]|uniref:Uncharacterized protein n=1 Tax=Morus notabilis TaxID=981085 RepID=W9R729_9ROSA|nr:hypothetical protein L484_023578 [Morus notabilis]